MKDTGEKLEKKGKGKPKKIFVTSVLLIFIIGAYFAVKNLLPLGNFRGSLRDDGIGEDIEESAGDLPEGFPSDFPVYPNASISNSWKEENDGKVGLSVVWETSESMDKVIEFYDKRLKEIYTEVTSTSDPQSSIFSFKSEGAGGFLGITKGEGGRTVISIAIGID